MQSYVSNVDEYKQEINRQFLDLNDELEMLENTIQKLQNSSDFIKNRLKNYLTG